MRCELEVVQALDQTVAGQLAAPAGTPPVAFHGWLELLRALETALAKPVPSDAQTPDRHHQPDATVVDRTRPCS